MLDSTIALVVGLGNPGDRYTANRHNAGVHFITRMQRVDEFQLTAEKRFHAKLGCVRIGAQVVRVMVPETYMNLSGKPVFLTAKFYQIPPQKILIIHDDLDLHPGVVRLKRAGGHGGHNGLRDIIAQLGSPDFLRLRIGIGHPGKDRDVSGYVLGNPNTHDQVLIEQAIDRAIQVLELIGGGDTEAAMAQLHVPIELEA